MYTCLHDKATFNTFETPHESIRLGLGLQVTELVVHHRLGTDCFIRDEFVFDTVADHTQKVVAECWLHSMLSHEAFWIGVAKAHIVDFRVVQVTRCWRYTVHVDDRNRRSGNCVTFKKKFITKSTNLMSTLTKILIFIGRSVALILELYNFDFLRSILI